MRLLALVQLLVLHHYRACCGGQDAPLVSILTLANGQTWCNRNALLNACYQSYPRHALELLLLEESLAPSSAFLHRAPRRLDPVAARGNSSHREGNYHWDTVLAPRLASEGALCGFGTPEQPGDPPPNVARVVDAAVDGTWLACGPIQTPFATLVAAAAAGHGGDGPTAVDVSLAPNGINFLPAPPTVSFYVYPNPSPSHLLPSSGPLAGGTTILVSGGGLAPGPHTNASLARCRVGRRESEPMLNVSAIDEAGVRCAPNSPTELYTIGVEKGVQVALNGQQFAPSALPPSGGGGGGGAVAHLP